MHERDRVGEPGEEHRLFERRVAAADHGDVLALEEEPIARGAPRDAAAGEPLLALDPELAVGRPHREHDGVRAVLDTVDGADRLHGAGELDLGRVVVDDARTEALGLRAHLLHEVGPHDALGEAGEVLDLGRGDERAAGLDRTREHDGCEPRPREVDRGRVTCRTGTDHDDALDRGRGLGARVAHG